MTAATALITVGMAAIAFLLYVFVALCRESRRGRHNVAYIGVWTDPEQVHVSRNPVPKVIAISSCERGQEASNAPQESDSRHAAMSITPTLARQEWKL